MNLDDLERHRKATEEEQKKLAAVDDLTLVMAGLGMLLHSARPTIYDFVPDDAAIVAELTERGRRKRRRRK